VANDIGPLGAHGERIAARLPDRQRPARPRPELGASARRASTCVARDGDHWSFCEVKTRRAVGFGHPVEAVGHAKQRRLRTLAQRWLAAHDEHAPELRFDVVGVLVQPDRPALVHPPAGGVLVTLARTWSVGLAGVHGAMVDVEVDLSAGVPGVVLVGLPDAVVRQSVDRVRAAVVNAGGRWPLRRITIGLSPASMPKQGSGFDLALAAAVLAADGAVPVDSVAGLVLLGELGLDGSVRAVRGVLPAVLAAARAGRPTVVVPAGNAGEAALVEGVEVLAAGTLAEVVAHLRGRATLPPHTRRLLPPAPPGPDLGDVVGQPIGRRAVEVAAAGGHHLFLSGPPGAGKTMLAERLPGLLPPLDEREALEVTAIHSVAGTLPPDSPLVTRPTFEARTTRPRWPPWSVAGRG
jgi:Holliday junction resolvase-like predicted endonuclease